MNIPEIDFSKAIDADAQLQQELQGMFAVDTQGYLQRYSQIAENLQESSWQSDIQELYRCVHTIKGGAVTVGAEAVLRVATALEDVLSDLRYLEPAPQLTDEHLSHLLLECGELLTVALELKSLDETELILNRTQALHQEVRTQYLSQWDQLKQAQQEFAEQGFDLVVLELEIALEKLPHQGYVPDSTVQIAQNVLTQLQQIGQEVQFDICWTALLDRAQVLFTHPANAVWKSQWVRLFQALKTCAKQGGELVAFEFEDFAIIELEAAPPEAWLGADTGAFLGAPNPPEAMIAPQIADWLDTLPPLEDLMHLPIEFATLDNPNSVKHHDSEFESADPTVEFLQPIPEESLASIDVASIDITATNTAIQPLLSLTNPTPVKERSNDIQERVQIPVTLEKLDQSAQSLIETLLALRTTQGFYETLQNQISQLVTLAQEGAQYISQLRQIQDDYALLDQLRDHQSDQGPSPERYRQGYTIINRLLENSLRLSEIGAETGKTSQQVAESFQRIERNTAKLQTTIEDSRLVPFQNLSLRAKAILRDLITRYGKPARLVVQGDQTELDVGIIKDLEPALLHLIRNAYDHGLEPPEERLAQGKPEQGTLTLSLRRQGNWFQFQIQDDGRGIDPKVVQSRASALGLPLTQTQASADLLAVICQPGFSSQTQVNEISGRGIGMDVVSAQVARLDGRLEIQTTPGIGTTFQLKFPVPRLLVPCILLQAEDHIFAIPNDDIRTIALFSSLDASPVQPINQADQASQAAWVVEDESGSTPVLDLLQYWQPQSLQRTIVDTAVCVRIVTAETPGGVWLLADELLDQSELIINPLPSPLIAPNGLIGVSLQANGTLIPVLEAQPLIERLLTVPIETELTDHGSPAPANPETDVITPTILIVDDAALMRRRLEASLKAYGYLTHTCIDGQDAWSWLQTHAQPDLIITDIEMPNMDGFTLVDRCRSQGITVPILVVSSRLSEEWSDEAHRLGATDYLTKGFSTVTLIKTVDSLLNTQTA